LVLLRTAALAATLLGLDGTRGFLKRTGSKMLRRALLLLILVLSAGLLPVLFGAKPAAAVVPEGFNDELVASVNRPIALAFTPDERMLILSKEGQLRVYEDGALLETPALDLTDKICYNNARGLQGVAVDPNFAQNHYIYLFYTFNKYNACPQARPRRDDNPVNRVSRFVLSDDNTVDRASETVLIDNIFSPFGTHHGGDLHFGKDGFLYVSTGDGVCDYAEPAKCQGDNDASRDRHVLLGKILRITRDGGIPASNPYTGAGSARCNKTGLTDRGKSCQETFAMGFRNPFRMAFDPDAAGTRFYINDVGGSAWEEINRGKAGADYGWNVREGHCAEHSSTDCGPPPAGMTNPIYDYSHKVTGCTSITGGAFVPDDAWRASYDDAYLFSDYVCNKIFKITPKKGGFTKTEFATGLGEGGPIAMIFGPHGSGEALYYTTFADNGQVRRIAPDTGNRPPTADVAADPPYSSTLAINFDGSGSSDPDGDTSLTYLWNFGDGTTTETTTPTTSHSYATAGKYTVTLRVRDSRDAVSDPDMIEVFPGDTPPEPVIEAPAADTPFKVGQTLTLRGSATDPEDEQLADASLSWEVLQHHDGSHTHPWFSGTGNDLTFEAPAPEGLRSTDPDGNYLEIRLTATDSQGLSKTTILNVRPKTVDVRFSTQPTGFRLKVNDRTFRAPETLVSWEGYELNVYAPAQVDGEGRRWAFRSWSDGGGATHTITTPSDAARYVARFERR
jgi:glucose/arabinose dehydrogenase